MRVKQFLAAISICIVFLGSLVAVAESKEEAATPESVSFTLLIVGTRHFSDIEVIKTNLQKMPAVHGFAQKISSQNHIEFSGTYSADRDSLIEDIQSLAADRYVVQTKYYKDRGLMITLRKISATSQ